LFATVATLAFVPVVFAMMHARDGKRPTPASPAGEPYVAAA
jgi:hypothetical protein